MTSIRDAGYRDELVKVTPSLRRFARALVQDNSDEAADDIVQASLVAAIGAGQDRRDIRLRIWTLSTLVALHRSAVRASVLVDKTVNARAGVGQTGQRTGDRWARPGGRAESLLLGTMPLECREVILLIALEELTYAQAAETLGISLNTLVDRLARARAHLCQAPRGASEPPPRLASRAAARAPAPYLRVVK